MSIRTCSIRMHEHQTIEGSTVYQHHKKEGHEIDFENVEILDRASNETKLQYKEMLYIRKFKPSLNIQTNSELFTLIIRNVKLNNSIESNRQHYVKNVKYDKQKLVK